MVARRGDDLVSSLPEPPVEVGLALRWSALKAAAILAQEPFPEGGRSAISCSSGGGAAGDRQYPAGVVITYGKHAWTWPVEDAFVAISLSPLFRMIVEHPKPGAKATGQPYLASNTACRNEPLPPICAGMVSTTLAHSSDRPGRPVCVSER